MTDSSSMQVPLGKALTSDMLFGLKPTAPKSRTYKMNIPALNKNTFQGGDMAIFEIPTRANCYLDYSQTFYKFSVQCTATAACTQGGSGIYVDNTAYSFLQRQDVYHSGSLLETTNELGQLASFLIDNTMSQSQKAGLSSMIGSNPHNTLALGTFTASAAYNANPYAYVSGTPLTGTTAALAGIIQTQVAGDRSGLSLSAVINTASYSTSIAYTFALPVLSGVIGVNASKMIPMGALGSPLRIELYLAANDDAIYYGTAGAGAVWTISNFELCVTYVEIDEPGYEQLTDPIYISGQSYRQSSATILANTSSEITLLLPFRFASLTALYARFLNQIGSVQGANATAAYRKSSSVNPAIQSYYWRVGASVIPNKPVYLYNGSIVQTGAEGFAELQKSFHSLGSITGEPAYKFNEYNVIGDSSGNAIGGWNYNYIPCSKPNGNIDTFSNAFAIGQELQSFSNRSDTILSGINTGNTQMFFTASIISGQSTPSVTAEFFAQYDVILIIEGGVMRAVF